MNEIEIYQTVDNQTEIEVSFENDTVWLTQSQMAELFDRDRVAITQHIGNIFKEKELEKESVCKESLHTAKDGKNYKTRFYNLDVIISVGYRVKSKRGTQFRQWATRRLKEFLVRGYALNEKRLLQVLDNLKLLEQAVTLIQSSVNSEALELREAKGLLEILGNYTHSFILLSQYDNHSLQSGNLNENITYRIQHDEATAAIAELKGQLIAAKEATELFGNPKDDSFSGILGNVVQSFGGHYLYPSIEEQAAHLLYFIIKNHPFSDGNKRIGAFIFVWFLEKNKHRFKQNGELKINDNALVALALLVAQSNPVEKELMVQLIVNLIINR